MPELHCRRLDLPELIDRVQHTVLDHVPVEAGHDAASGTIDDLDTVRGGSLELGLGELGATDVACYVCQPTDPHAPPSAAA